MCISKPLVDKGFLQLRASLTLRNPKRRKDFMDFASRGVFTCVMDVTFLPEKNFKKFLKFP